MSRKNGFTLVELMVVVVIIGVLVTFSAPGFTKMKERGMDKDAKVMVGLLIDKAKMHKLQEGTYPNCTDLANCEAVMGMELDDGGRWDYRIDVLDPDMAVVATRTGGSLAARMIWYNTQHTDKDIHCGGADCFFDGTDFVPLS